MARVDVSEPRDKVTAMYRAAAEELHGRFHFEMGKTWPAGWATRPPAGRSVESFARVAATWDWPLPPRAGGSPDLGSGPGPSLFLAARQAGTAGEVIGLQTGCKAGRPG